MFSACIVHAPYDEDTCGERHNRKQSLSHRTAAGKQYMTDCCVARAKNGTRAIASVYHFYTRVLTGGIEPPTLGL